MGNYMLSLGFKARFRWEASGVGIIWMSGLGQNNLGREDFGKRSGCNSLRKCCCTTETSLSMWLFVCPGWGGVDIHCSQIREPP